jgi:hypothetical protein
MPYQGLDVERPALGANGWILMYCKSQQLSHGEMPRLFLIDLTGNNERESTHDGGWPVPLGGSGAERRVALLSYTLSRWP